MMLVGYLEIVLVAIISAGCGYSFFFIGLHGTLFFGAFGKAGE